jgi:hypothetical protein
MKKCHYLRMKLILSLSKNHLPNLGKRWNKNTLSLAGKLSQKKTVYKAICSLKKKKSAGIDGISQEQLVLGAKVLVVPLTRIINNSISSGEFPSIWKEATATMTIVYFHVNT